MSYANTPAQQNAKDLYREVSSEKHVPKEMRAKALRLAGTITNIERRTHALVWVKSSSRYRSEIEDFIKKMEEVKE